MTSWSLVYEGFEPDKERLREALCTLGNGYFASRGAAPEAEADAVHYPGTYLAGGYNRLFTEVAGRPIENEDLVNFPNWLPFTFRIASGKWFNLLVVEVLFYRQELDLKRGVLLREVRFRDEQGRQTRLTNQRLVHMGNPHLAALETTLTAENWSGQIEIRSALDGRVVNAGVERYKNLNSKHLKPIETGAIGEDSIYLKVQTTQSEIQMAQAARTEIFLGWRPGPSRAPYYPRSRLYRAAVFLKSHGGKRDQSRKGCHAVHLQGFCGLRMRSARPGYARAGRALPRPAGKPHPGLGASVAPLRYRSRAGQRPPHGNDSSSAHVSSVADHFNAHH